MQMVPVNNDSKFSRYGEVSEKTALEGRGPAGLRLPTGQTGFCAEPLDPAKEKSALESLEGVIVLVCWELKRKFWPKREFERGI